MLKINRSLLFLSSVFLTAHVNLNVTLANAKSEGAQLGNTAPAFNLPELNHPQKNMSLKSLEGKVVLVDFWASWCPPCKKTVPDLGKMRSRNPSLVVLALSIDEDRNKAISFLKSSDTSLVFLHDAKHSVAEKFNLGGMPSAFLIDKHGILRNRFDGYTEAEMQNVEVEVKKLIEEKM